MKVNATGIIFSNMHDEELQEITSCRTMGSLPFGGKYRIIDFALSNMHNSGVTSVGVITKSNYQSLIDHLKSGKEWDLLRKREGLFIFPPYGRQHSGFYKNKIEALYGVMTYIKKSKNDYIIITDCDVICNMNWNLPLDFHLEKKADITVICFHKDPGRYTSDNETVYQLSEDGYIKDILINQKASSTSCVGSNMWIIGKNFLETVLEDAVAHNYENFERDIMQRNLNRYKIAAWKYEGYINKINSVSDYFQINMDLLNPSVREELFFMHGLIYTKDPDDVPARYAEHAQVRNSLIANGCEIEGTVENSILFREVHIGKNSEIKNSILMPGCRTGENVNLNYVLADKNVLFQNSRILMGYDKHPVYLRKGSIV